jgi:hypothetical protein
MKMATFSDLLTIGIVDESEDALPPVSSLFNVHKKENPFSAWANKEEAICTGPFLLNL